MKYIYLLIITLGIQAVAFSQIDLNEVSEKQKKDRNSKRDSAHATAIYALTNWSMSFRSLEVNEGLFGEPLGSREFESWRSTFSYGIGIQNRINKFLFWDGGLGFATNGEKLVQEKVDTIVTNLRSFRYMTLPIRINASYGQKFRISAGVGLCPQLFMNSSEITTEERISTGSEEETKVKIKDGNNTFVISALFNVGLKVELAKGFALWFSPEFRMHLNSSYGETQPYIHKGRSLGLNFGLLFQP